MAACWDDLFFFLAVAAAARAAVGGMPAEPVNHTQTMSFCMFLQGCLWLERVALREGEDDKNARCCYHIKRNLQFVVQFITFVEVLGSTDRQVTGV